MNDQIPFATVNTEYVSSPIGLKDFRKVSVATVRKFDYAMDREKPFFKRVVSFIRGENELGRKVGAVLDIVTLFLPGYIRTGREAVQIITQKQNKAMKILTDKPWYESKSIWSAIIVLITGILQSVGVDFGANPELVETVYVVLYHVAGALGLYGLRDALGKNIPPKHKQTNL